MKKIHILTVILVVSLAILGFVVSSNRDDLFTSQKETEIPQNEVEEEISLIIDYGEGSPWMVKSEFEEGITAFGLLEEKAEEFNLVIKAETYDFGTLVETIGDKENGEDGKYWLYYVNDEMPMVACDQKEINPGDKVEFKFEKSPF